MIPITITVYGAEEKCASCIHLPSAYETKEWLEAAITRKFPNEKLSFEYCDINDELKTEEQVKYSQMILDDEYFYPLVVINGEVVAEGNPNLPSILKKISKLLQMDHS
ncbi:YuzD family protein [Evansella sp. AB-P1]|uniref:YuzD family protein n=1 Tax=Evansella sp. AB-P1 TaxID=3037653 RepID=UPI00241CBF3B|nr:YuzD family protein [Evansella sp. AB-P1]MDG5788893.1 YuzD family protein [Evansella sp. AB-P1]